MRFVLIFIFSCFFDLLHAQLAVVNSNEVTREINLLEYVKQNLDSLKSFYSKLDKINVEIQVNEHNFTLEKLIISDSNHQLLPVWSSLESEIREQFGFNPGTDDLPAFSSLIYELVFDSNELDQLIQELKAEYENENSKFVDPGSDFSLTINKLYLKCSGSDSFFYQVNNFRIQASLEVLNSPLIELDTGLYIQFFVTNFSRSGKPESAVSMNLYVLDKNRLIYNEQVEFYRQHANQLEFSTVETSESQSSTGERRIVEAEIKLIFN